ncbi:hypothetical protein AOLI_G00164820 [Acnodon oligacanthus]
MWELDSKPGILLLKRPSTAASIPHKGCYTLTRPKRVQCPLSLDGETALPPPSQSTVREGSHPQPSHRVSNACCSV